MSDERRNTGNGNTGDLNTGDWNTGDLNTGNRNTGNRNTGPWNTGNGNTGHWNTGDWNTGNRNTGYWNTGHLNTGDWNTGDWNTGFFCTETPSPMFFDHPTGLTWEQAFDAIPHIDLPIGAEWVPSDEMTEQEKTANPNHKHIGGFLRKHERPIQEVFPEAWAKMGEAEREQWRSLPNFDKLTREKSITLFGIDIRREAETHNPEHVQVTCRECQHRWCIGHSNMSGLHLYRVLGRAVCPICGSDGWKLDGVPSDE